MKNKKKYKRKIKKQGLKQFIHSFSNVRKKNMGNELRHGTKNIREKNNK